MRARHAATSGNRSFRRFDFAWRMMIAIFRAARFCWYPETLIHGDENVEFGCSRGGKEIAVLQSGKSGKTGCLAIVTGQRVPESLIDALVDQNAHLRACEQEVFCFFKGSNGRFTRDGGKSLQKVFECFSALEVVEQRLNRHSGSAKHRTSPKNVRVFDDDSHEVIVSRAIVAKIASPGQVGTGAEPPLQGRSFCFNARRAGALPIPGSAGARFRTASAAMVSSRCSPPYGSVPSLFR